MKVVQTSTEKNCRFEQFIRHEKDNFERTQIEGQPVTPYILTPKIDPTGS